MSETRLTGADKRTLALWIICGILGVVFAQKFFFRAFPEASVDFKVSRGEAEKRAKEFIEGLGENLAGYQSTITFDVDDNAKTYLERELGLREANRLMSAELSIWYWDVRFFKPQQEEEFRARVSPGGKVVGYDHMIEEARSARSLSREQALYQTQQFLAAKLGTDLKNWEFLPAEANTLTRPNRVDWSFTWERKGFKAKEAPYRLEAGVQGDRIGDEREFLQVPEAWSRDYQHLRSTNVFYNQVALIPYGFLMGAALWLGISLTRQGKTAWGAALKVGLLVAVLFSLMQLNDWNSLRAGYDTHASYSSFVAIGIAKLLVAAIGTGLLVTLVLPGGEPLYRAAQPGKLRLYDAFSARGLRSKEFFCSSVIGISMAAAHIGFIVAFYMVGSKLGVWAPQDLNYSDVVNTSFPWIAGVAIGVMAATSEEFLFRLFAIPFLQKMTGSRVLAVVLPAFFWSFLHSAYPQEPGYIRGLEVGIIGLVAGVVMLRWGILATLIWHYTVDASLVGMLLIRSDNLYFKISGVIVGLAALAPIAFSGVLYLARGRFEEVDDLLNAAAPAQIHLAQQTIADEAVETRKRYDPLTVGTIGFLAFAALAGGLVAWRVKSEHIGDYLRQAIDGKSAIVRADAAMREHGLDPNSFRKAAQFVDTTSPVTNEFLLRRMSLGEINKIYAQQVPGALWRVRYFRDSQPEEFAITLRPDGSVHAFRHTLAEATKGANLGKEEAQTIAEKFLTETKRIDLSGWKLVEANSDKRPNRTDHTLTWQQNAPLDPVGPAHPDAADHAYARMDAQVLGDQAVNYRTYIKVPEEFERRQEEQTLPRTLVSIGQGALAIGLIVAVLVYYFKRLRVQPAVAVPWRRLFWWGMAGWAAFMANFLLGSGIPSMLAQYPTAMPMKLYYGTATVGLLIIGALVLAGIMLLFGLAWSFAARAFGEEWLPTWTGMPGAYYRDAFWIGLGGSALLIALRRLVDAASFWWPTAHRFVGTSFGESFEAIFPAVAIIGGAVMLALFGTGVISLASAFLGAELRVRWLRLLLFFLIAASLVRSWGSPGDFLKQFVFHLILLGVVMLGIRRVVRFNLLGLFLAILCPLLLAGAVGLLAQPDGFYRTHGYIALASVVVVLAWPLVVWRGSAGNTTQA